MAKSKAVSRRRYFPKRRGTRKRASMTIPVAIVAGIVPTVVGVWNRRSSGEQVAQYLQAGFTGIGADGKFNISNLRAGLMPIVAGFGVHMIASKLGINKAIARARVPFIRI